MSLTKVRTDSTRLETVMSWIFGVGIILASAFVITGIVLSHHPDGGLNLLTERGDFIHKSNFFILINALVRSRNIPTGPLFFVTLGMVSLVLTPLLAVAAAFVYFAGKGDKKMAAVSLVVMAILVTSLAVH